MKGATTCKERIKTTLAHCLMRMVGDVVNDGRRHERLLHINVTHRGERMENQRAWQAWWSQISVSGADRLMPAKRQPRNIWLLQKKTTDAWLMLVGFTVLSSTFLLTPSARDVISSLTTQQNSSAILLLWNIRLPMVIHK